MEENINNWQSVVWQTYPAPTLKDFAESFNTHQLNVRKAVQQIKTTDDISTMEGLYDTQATADDKQLATDAGKAIRKSQLAFWIKSFYKDNYPNELNEAWINLDAMTIPEIIDWYTELNPNSYDMLKNYVTTETDINNPLWIYYSLWFMPSQESTSITNNIKDTVNKMRSWDWSLGSARDEEIDNAKEYWKNLMESELSWPTELYYWFRNFVNWVQWIWDDDAEWFWAVQNYAHDMLWKDVSDLSTLELYSITEALKNPEVYADHKPTPAKAWIETLAWTTDTMFTIAARPVKLLFSALDADPMTNPAMRLLWWTQEEFMWRGIWWILTFPLTWYINDLPEQDRKKFYAWLWSVLTLWFTAKSKNSWTWTSDTFREFIKEITPDALVNWFENKVLRPVSPLEWGWGIKNMKDNIIKENDAAMVEWLKNSDYYNSLPPEKRAELDLHSNKVLTSDTIWENKDVSRALMQLDQKSLKTIKSYDDLFKLNKKEIDRLIDMENTIAGTIEKRFWPEEDIWEWDEVTVAWKYKWETEPNHPIKEFFDTMKLLLENESPNLRKALDWYEQKYLNWEIDSIDLLNFKRALSQSYMKYKYSKTSESSNNVASWKKPVWDSDIRRIYDWLNYLLRDSMEWPSEFRDVWLGNIMETLDQRLSPHLNLRTRLIVMANALNKELWKIPEDILSRKIANNAKSIPSLSLTWIISWLADKLTKSKEKMTAPTDYVENLSKSLKQITDILKEFPDEQRWLIMDSLADYLKRKFAWPNESYWGTVEWEVIEDPWITDDFIDWTSEFNRNPFLEDIVEVVPKESNMLWNDPKYNWNPVDYTNPTRVTPEWYAWRKWATSESYKWKPAWDFWTPAEFENRQWNPYEKTWEAYSEAMEQAGFSVKQIEKVKETLEKNDYKIKQQPSLFEDFPTKEETATIVKENKWEPKTTLQDVLDELKKLEESTKDTVKKSESKSKSNSNPK